MILDLQRRMRQLGEIRIGQVVPTRAGKTRPDKLDRFRFTSPDEAILRGVALKYGGDVKPWTPANGGPSEFEVITDAKRLPVIVPPGSLTQWYELYAGSLCQRRCDGRTEQKSDRPCVCDPEKRACSLTTRMNLILREVGPLGVWLLTTRGYYAAIELPAIAELLEQAGGNIPGWLGLEERIIRREGAEGKIETNRFMVPTLDIDVTPGELLAAGPVVAVGTAPNRHQIATGARQQITAAPTVVDGAGEAQRVDVAARVAACGTGAELVELWRELQAHDLADLDPPDPDVIKQLISLRAAECEEEKREHRGAWADADPINDAIEQAVEPLDAEEAWDACVSIASRFDPPMTTTTLRGLFMDMNDGMRPDDATADDLIAFRDHLRSMQREARP